MSNQDVKVLIIDDDPSILEDVSLTISDVPVIFLSGAEIPNILRRAHAAGGSYYLRKPSVLADLVDLVEKALWMPHLVAGQIG